MTSDEIRTAIRHRLYLAEAATQGPWECQVIHVHMDGRTQVTVRPPGKPKVFADTIAGGDGPFIAANSPDFAARVCRADLQRLAAHTTWAPDGQEVPWCSVCVRDSPCPERVRLAEVYL